MGMYTVTLYQLLKTGWTPALSKYPIFDESYRDVLNQKIINHFMFEEIGAETPDAFNFYLNNTMCEIMPYYNKLYLSEKIKIDPFNTTNVVEVEINQYTGSENSTQVENLVNSGTTENHNTTNTENSGNTANNDSRHTFYNNNHSDLNQDFFSDTPQMRLGNPVEDGYVSNYTKKVGSFNDNHTGTDSGNADSSYTNRENNVNTSNSSTSSKSSSQKADEKNQSDTRNIKRQRYGNENQNLLQILKELRESFMNIDKMILEDKELQSCFMSVY